MRVLFFFLVSTPGLLAQPIISSGGIVNAAGYQPAGSPGGGIAQGSIFSIFGTGLGPPFPGLQASSFPLSATLGGVSVRLAHQAGVTVAAIPLFVSSSQINAILPSNMPVGLVSVSVSFNGREGSTESVKVVRSSFGVFARSSAGTGPAIVQNFVSASDQRLNSPAEPAAPGQTVVVWGTGLGPIAGPDNLSPTPANRNEPIEVTLAGRPVAVDYQGRSGCCAGVDQINFRVPADAPLGCAVPLAVTLQNGVYSNLTTIAIGPGGQPCADGLNPPGGTRRWGDIALVRTVSEPSGAPVTADVAAATFAEGEPPARFPALGSCTSDQSGPPATLGAGPELTLAGPQGSRAMPRDPTGRYRLSSTGSAPFLGPGAYTLSGPAGPDVGPFQVFLTAPSSLVWTSAGGTRASGIAIRWTGGDSRNDFALISGPSFTCAASAAPGAFTLPPAVLANLPAQATIQVGSVSQAAFLAPGLDRGVLTYTHATARPVVLGEPPLAASPVRLPNSRMILAELAVTSAERQVGLMQRAELAPDRGMLFLYDRPGFFSFWMYRTLIPLDIVWLDQDRRIVFISANTPPCRSEDPGNCPVYGGRESAQYVLEIGAGLAAQQGLRVGDRLEW